MWTPYFSVHFPHTSAGAKAGLLAYQQLRELALQRQLSPPADFLMSTEEDIRRAADKKGDPVDLQEKMRKHEIKLPNLNQMLPKKLRAQKLMDQRATSVADVSFVLSLANEGRSPVEKFVAGEIERREKHKERSQRAKRRLRLIREQEAVVQGRQDLRSTMVETNPGQLSLNHYATARLSMEHGGTIAEIAQVKELDENLDVKQLEQQLGVSTRQELEDLIQLRNKKEKLLQKIAADVLQEWQEQHKGQEVVPDLPKSLVETRQKEAIERFEAEEEAPFADVLSKLQSLEDESRDVKVLWADMRDGTYAQSWPGNVFHGELESLAVARRYGKVIRQHAAIDEEENWIDEQREVKKLVAETSVHVIGTEVDGGWGLDKADLDAEASRRRSERQTEDERTQAHLVMMKMRKLRQEIEKKRDRAETGDTPLTSMQATLSQLEKDYPKIKEQEDRHDEWVSARSQRAQLCKQIERMQESDSVDAAAKGEYSQDDLGQLRNQLASLDQDYPEIAELESNTAELKSKVMKRAQEIQQLRQELKTQSAATDGKEGVSVLERVSELEQLQREDKGALRDISDQAERDFRRVDDNLNYGQSDKLLEDEPKMREQQESQKEVLRAAGVEIEEPRRGIWSRLTGAFRR